MSYAKAPLGLAALANITTGYHNVAVGHNALYHNVTGPVGTGGAGGAGTAGSGAGAGRFDGSGYVLVQQRLKEWEWYQRFIEMNPDLKDRWEQHKTYEILNNDDLQQR